MIDTKKISSIALLGWNFWAHMFRKYLLRRKSAGYDQFIENYRADRIVPFSGRERERLNEFSKCISCGLCDPVCPSLRAGGRSHFAGPMDLAICVSRDPTELGVSPDPFRSVLCEACDRACPEGVPVVEIITYMRAKTRETHPESLPPFYRKAQENLSETGNVFGAPRPSAMPSQARILYWRGCRESRSIAKGGQSAGMRLLDLFGIKFQAVVEDCCGGLPAQMGLDWDTSKALERISAVGADILVTNCPLCLRTIEKALPELRARHVLSVVADKINSGAIREFPLRGAKVAYHDPCLLGRALGIYDMPREIIAGLGGELIRMPREREDAPCCGAGGAAPEVDPDLALRMARDRVEEALASNVSTLLTACDECASQLALAVRPGESLKALTIADVILNSG